jgi:hypothetical protein
MPRIKLKISASTSASSKRDLAGEPLYAPSPGLQALLRPAYQAFSQAAVDKAFGDEQNENSA